MAARHRGSGSPRAPSPLRCSDAPGGDRCRSHTPAMKSGQRGWKGHPVGPVERMRDRAAERRRAWCAAFAMMLGIERRAPRIGMLRRVKDVVHGPFSTARPRYMTTTSSAISAITPMSWVIRIAPARAPAAAAQQVEDLRLGGDVERGGRLVGDQHARVAGECHRDHHTLAQAARKLEWIFVDPPLRLWHADGAQELDCARVRLVACASLCRGPPP